MMKTKTEIKFNKKKHSYTLGKKKLTPVTTFLKTFFAEFDDKAIAKRVAFFRNKKGIKTTARQVLAEWKQIATEGSEIHKQIETALVTKEMTALTYPQSRAAVDFILSRLALTDKYECEKVLYDINAKLAGTSDLVVWHNDNTFSIYDWKTNRNLRQKSFDGKVGNIKALAHIEDCNFNHYQLQLSIYAHMIEEQTGKKIRALHIVHLPKEGSSIAYRCSYFKDEVKEMIKTWQKD